MARFHTVARKQVSAPLQSREAMDTWEQRWQPLTWKHCKGHLPHRYRSTFVLKSLIGPRSDRTHKSQCLPAAVEFLCSLTFVAVSDCVKVHVVLLVGEEQEAEPGVKSIDGDDEEDSDDVPLFVGRTVVTQMHVDLNRKRRRRMKIKAPLTLELKTHDHGSEHSSEDGERWL